MQHLPSQFRGRNTYVTPKGGSTDAVGLPQQVAGFEMGARISRSSCFLTYLSVFVHETMAVGLYVLLFDVRNASTGAQGTNIQATSADVANGDLALVTVGPSVAAGSTFEFSEGDVDPPISMFGGNRVVEPSAENQYAGFPFDSGVVAVLSTTGGRLTLPVPGGQTPLAGARFTARLIYCG